MAFWSHLFLFIVNTRKVFVVSASAFSPQWRPVSLYYKGEPLNKDFVIDILVQDEIILELKAVDGILPVHEAQIISYLRLANKRLGFLINFNVPLLKQGFKRYVNNL